MSAANTKARLSVYLSPLVIWAALLRCRTLPDLLTAVLVFVCVYSVALSVFAASQRPSAADVTQLRAPAGLHGVLDL